MSEVCLAPPGHYTAEDARPVIVGCPNANTCILQLAQLVERFTDPHGVEFMVILYANGYRGLTPQDWVSELPDNVYPHPAATRKRPVTSGQLS